MLFIKCTCFIERIMEFIPSDACITGAIQKEDKMVDDIKEGIFECVVMFAIEPIYFITSNSFIMGYKQFIACSCRTKLLG